MMASLLRDADEGGWLPKWPVANGYTGVMNGDAADPILAGAYAFGARGFDSGHAVDLMVNVNRFSLFDLSIIEAAEAGLAMLLHATGGNIRFHQLGAGALMLPDLNVATVTSGLEQCFTMSGESRAALGRASRRCYDEHLTLQHLWRGHAKLYDRATADRYARSES